MLSYPPIQTNAALIPGLVSGHPAILFLQCPEKTLNFRGMTEITSCCSAEMETLTLLSPLFLPSPLLRRLKPQNIRISLRRSDSTPERISATKMISDWNWQEWGKEMHTDADYGELIRMLCKNKMPDVALQLVLDMKSEGVVPNSAALSALMLCYAQNGLFSHAQALWDELINSSFVPEIEVVSDLMDAYGNMGCFDEVNRVLRELTSRDFNMCPEVYSLAISCFGRYGQLEMMEATVKEMLSNGFEVDSYTGNIFVRYYSSHGSLTDMETAYGRLKRSGILIEEDTIRAMAFAYISKRRFYKLGEFLRDVGPGRRNTGNLLWNLLLLSYAANFKMKSLQREFLSMLDAGFSPDLNTFNIRALAFSRMSMFWDLHVSIEHMKHEKVVPDLVTYGCFVDAYLERRLGRNLSFALNKMNVDSFPLVLTDPLVFEVFGKGDFHSSSEVLLESKKRRELTYSKLIAVYLKKQYRRNQIFWNY